ncbi:S-adenosyl-L-methionine-dependent methyltransferase [Aspergillus ambiguus]|uniref:S-adenosyl-L-methionine-dependent methyltransferase n=1 Tax=Aspergillus ambiguus TaxID=176160 RepID=UPI003CCCF0C7
MTGILEQIDNVMKLAVADADENGDAHTRVETPLETISRFNLQKGFLSAIATRDRTPTTAADISHETGIDTLFIAAIGYCNELDHNTYGANEITHLKTQPASIAAEKHHSLMIRVTHTTLFNFTFGATSIFDYLPHNPEQKHSFDKYMSSRRTPDAPQWFDIFPAADKLPNQGIPQGNTNDELARFKQQYPDIAGRLIVQDLPLTLRLIDKLPGGVEIMEHDFFIEQPVKGARAYFLCDVLHNWSDAKAQRILSRLVDAMNPTYSMLLIDNYVLPDKGTDIRAAEMNILMWMHTSGIERTVSQWTSLLRSAGLGILRIWTAGRAAESVIEARIYGSTP